MDYSIKESKDTYFSNSNDALKEALKNNFVLAPNNQVRGLQVCYYNGKQLKDAPKNCINVIQKNFIKYFTKTKNRIPTVFFDKKNTVQKELFEKDILEVNQILEQKINTLEQKIINQEPSFNDKKLRIFGFGCRETVLIKHIVKNIINAAKDLNFEVYLHKQKNDMQSCHKLHYLKALYKFNPHITININHLNNSFLNKKVFNFIWFQDNMTLLLNDTKPFIRKKDYFYALTKTLCLSAIKKNMNAEYQSFCLDENIYKERKKIIKEKKIVFIGSSYKHRILEIEKEKDFKKIYLHMIKIFNEKGCLTSIKIKNSDIKYLMNKYNKSQEYIDNIYAYIGRDYCIERLCNLNTDFKIEIYGYGFENNPIISPYNKGIIKYGKNVSKVYNSATYAYCPGGYVLMQRTLESAFSGTIPLVLDSRADNEDIYNEKIENSLQFFTVDNLENVLTKKIKNCKFDIIKQYYSYNTFVNKIIKQVNNNL